MSERRAPTGASGLTSLHEGLLIAFDAMHANAIRSSLTILGVAVGVSVVVALAALITGIRSTVMETFEEQGPNNLLSRLSRCLFLLVEMYSLHRFL